MKESDEQYRLRKTIELTKKLALFALFVDNCNRLGGALPQDQLMVLENFLFETRVMKGQLVDDLVGKGKTMGEIAKQLGVSKALPGQYQRNSEAIQRRRARAKKDPTEEVSILDRRIEEFPLSVRIKTCCRAEEIVTVRQLTSRTLTQLRKVPNLGALSIKNIVVFLDSHGLKLAL